MRKFYREIRDRLNLETFSIAISFEKKDVEYNFDFNSILRRDKSDNEVFMYEFLNRRYSALIGDAVSEGLRDVINISNNYSKSYRSYKIIMALEPDSENSFFTLVVLDTHTKTYLKDLDYFMSLTEKFTLENLLVRLKSLDVIYCEFL